MTGQTLSDHTLFKKKHIFRHCIIIILECINFWLCWVFIAAPAFLWLPQAGGSSLVVVAGFSLWCLLLSWSRDSRAYRLRQLWHVGSGVAAPGLQSTDSAVVVHGLSCPMACGIFPRQGSNLHWQAYLYHWATREAPIILFKGEVKTPFFLPLDLSVLTLDIRK